MPQAFLPGADETHKAWLEVLLGFNSLVCISKAVAEEVEEWINEHGSKRQFLPKIDWFHLGADIDISSTTMGFPDDAERVLGRIRSRSCFLVVGTIEPRKGHAQVLDAFEQLWQAGQDVNLIIVGKRGWMVESLVERLNTHPELGGRLFWLEGISDEYLKKVYTASNCLIAASYGEGFGLPLIEAAQYKLPIIARDIPVFREVAGEHAFYFNGKAPGDLVQAITEWLQLYEAGKHPISGKISWLTWKESAARLMQIVLKNDTKVCVPAFAQQEQGQSLSGNTPN
jgi:glycosyltransferase involved in cell wall biosynthesis